MKLLQLGLKFDYFVFLINELLIAWKCYPLLKAFLHQFFLVSMADCSWLLGLRSCATMTGKYWSLSNSSCLWNMIVQLRLFVYGSSVPHKDIGELRLIVSLILRGAPLLIVEEVFIVIVKIILCSSELNNPSSNRWCIQFFDSKSLFCMIFENLLNIRCPLYNFILLIVIW